MGKRITWIDVAKGIAMLLIITLHINLAYLGGKLA